MSDQTELPAKYNVLNHLMTLVNLREDLWELERRNLILYEDKKLGSGAFGAVYMGKLIGLAKGHKDAQSTLGVNLMRAENCDVAVKMLPGLFVIFYCLRVVI